MRKIALIISAALLVCSCGSNLPRPADPDATKETVKLFQSLWQLQQKGVMYGHQDDLMYGYSWWYEEGRSDTKDFTGDYPAVAGFELGHIELGAEESLDGVNFKQIAEQVKAHYKRGGVITISWHLNNPLTMQNPDSTLRQPGTAWDVSSKEVVKSILPGGDNHGMFNEWMGRLADYLKTFKDDDGTPIPFLFRPWHEHSGDFFWWGTGICTDEEYAALWRYTVDFLKKEGLHNILYVYNTDRVTSLEQYMRGYPGDDIIDMMALDMYDRGETFGPEVDAALGFITPLAIEKQKLTALSETSNGVRRTETWWSETLLPILSKYPVGYVLTWRNTYYGKMSSFGRNMTPEAYEAFIERMKNQPAFPADFKIFYDSPRSLFLNDIIIDGKTVYE